MIRKLLLIPVVIALFFAAVVITLVALHVVTVGGVYAYSSLKAHELMGQPAPAPAQPPKPVAKIAVPSVAPETKPVSNTALAPASAPAANGNFYTVVKGDNPVTIAKKLHVTSADLQKINNITDPKKLQVGQKLRIPAKNETMPPTQS